jgi:type I site-specific restriction endonuclease
MATGSGKTYTAATLAYRLIEFADARRVLFLVDRSNLGRQARGEFQRFTIPGTGRKFTEVFNIQRSRRFDRPGESRLHLYRAADVLDPQGGEAR